MQRTQVTELAAAWRGSGAESATRFLQRHCDAAEEVAAHVRAAAEQCAALRDDVWQAIDGKVATTVAIDERRAAERSTWLAAAQAVTAGTGDRSAAEAGGSSAGNTIRGQRYSQRLARGDELQPARRWRRPTTTAIHALASTRDVRFDIPGDLGPTLAAGASAQSPLRTPMMSAARRPAARRSSADRAGCGTAAADTRSAAAAFGRRPRSRCRRSRRRRSAMQPGCPRAQAVSAGSDDRWASAVSSGASSTVSAACWAHWPAARAMSSGNDPLDSTTTTTPTMTPSDDVDKPDEGKRRHRAGQPRRH